MPVTDSHPAPRRPCAGGARRHPLTGRRPGTGRRLASGCHLARRSAWGHLLHTVLPAPCFGCGEPLPAAAALALCGRCRARLRRGAGDGCRRCGAPGTQAGHECPACRRLPPAFERLIAPWWYEPPLDAVVQALKFRRLDRLGAALAAPLAAGLGGHRTGCDLVVPVPLHWRRRLARGYNQAERIARPLARRLGLPCVAALARRRPTPPQTALARSARRRSVAGAFAAVPRHHGALANRRVLLVDDVVTTGATLDAAARCLRRAGAAAVVAVAVARTPPERPGAGDDAGAARAESAVAAAN